MAKTLHDAGGLSSIPGQGTRSHMPQQKILCAATERSACLNQDPMHTNNLKKKKKELLGGKYLPMQGVLVLGR